MKICKNKAHLRGEKQVKIMMITRDLLPIEESYQIFFFQKIGFRVKKMKESESQKYNQKSIASS